MQEFPIPQDAPLTSRQRWASVIAIVVALAVLGVGFFMKGQRVIGTTAFQDLAAGILAQYPNRWLLDTAGDYVFRVQDPLAPGFRTTLQVELLPIGEDAAARNIVDSLTLARAQTLAAYDILQTEPYTLPDGEEAAWIEYVYVATEVNPFLDSIPAVVRGVDIVTLKRGQAIIVTFRVEANQFEEELWRLEQFLASLEF